jgi:hypothetical protein
MAVRVPVAPKALLNTDTLSEIGKGKNPSIIP